VRYLDKRLVLDVEVRHRFDRSLDILDLRVAERPQNCGAFVRGLLDELLGAENLRAKGRGRAVRFAE